MYNDDFPILLGYQDRWNREEAPCAAIEKTRRCGLSWGDAAERVIYAAEGRGNVYYMSYNKDMTSGYIKDCALWAKRYQRVCSDILEEEIIDEDGKTVLAYRIRFESGKSIVALPSSPRVLRSRGDPGDIVIVDEAAFVDNLDALVKAAVAYTMWGGKVRFISTHDGDENPFNELVNDIRAGRKEGWAVHRVTIDDAIAEGLARRICTITEGEWDEGWAERWLASLLKLYGDAADEELRCIPSKGTGAWLSRVLIESRSMPGPMIRFYGTPAFNALPEPVRKAEMRDWLDDNALPVLRTLDPDRRHVIGGDFARSGDMSSYAPLEIGATLQRRNPFILEMKNTPHAQQVQAVRYVCDRLPRFSGGAFDARGNGSYLAEAMVDAYGSLIEPVMPSEAWYRENMPSFKAAFEDDFIRVIRHEDVVDDLRAFRMVRGVPRLPEGKTDKKGERHGDSGMALALAWNASESDRGLIDGQVAGAPVSHGYEGFAPPRIDEGLGIVEGVGAQLRRHFA